MTRPLSLRPSLAALLLAASLGLAGGPAAAQSAEDIAAVQGFLATRGYEPGPADGVMGARTHDAITAFEIEQGRTPSGELSPWLIELARTGGAAVQAGDDGSTVVQPMSGDPAVLGGTGSLAFTEQGDGTLLITDGFPWRAGISVAPRTLDIISTEMGMFETQATSLVPVPLGEEVVDVPGSTFVPLALAHDRAAAERGSLADAVGVTWRFQEGMLRLQCDGFVLTANDPGATMEFRSDGVLLTGFILTPE